MQRRARSDQSGTHYLNVDLDVTSSEDLAPLVAALEPKAYCLHCERVGRRYVATFELSSLRLAEDADLAVAAFAKMIAALPPAARRLWKRATSRVLDVGIQARAEPHSFHLDLRASALAAAAKLGCDIAVTVYAPERRRRAAKKPAKS